MSARSVVWGFKAILAFIEYSLLIYKFFFTALISYKALRRNCSDCYEAWENFPSGTLGADFHSIPVWGTAWESRSPRSPNCLNLNLRSFLCCLTNYQCTQLCGVSARRSGSIVPEHPFCGFTLEVFAGLNWHFFSSNNRCGEDRSDWLCTCQAQWAAAGYKFKLRC